MSLTICDGIIIGAAGGALAGLTVWLVQYAHDKLVEQIECMKIYNWLKNHTSNKDGEQFRSTRAIASYNNLTEDRVRYLCSIDKKIFLSTGKNEDLWSIYEHGKRIDII